MVIDNIKNCGRYGFDENFKAAFDFIASFSDALPTGCYEINDNVFALVQEYASKPEEDCAIEAHKKYIDIQYIALGREKIGFARLFDCAVLSPYDEEKDIAFFTGETTLIDIPSGEFAIFFPEEAHKPQIGDGKKVRKIVVKIKA